MNAGVQNRIRILIAEDSPLCQKLVETALTNQPYEVQFAATGQEALRLFEAKLLKANTRSADFFGRLSGDEFLVIISHAEKKAIFQTVDRLRADFASERLDLDGHQLQITASFGIAGFQAPNDKTVADLLARADKALYSAKSAGRNQVVAAPDREFILRI